MLRAWGQNFTGHYFEYYRRQIMVLALVVLLCCGLIQRGRAEDTFTYRYEKYQEGGGRIGVETHSGSFDVTLRPRGRRRPGAMATHITGIPSTRLT